MEQEFSANTPKSKAPHDGNSISENSIVKYLPTINIGLTQTPSFPRMQTSRSASTLFTLSDGTMHNAGIKAGPVTVGTSTRGEYKSNAQSNLEVMSKSERSKIGSLEQRELDRVKGHPGNGLPSEVPGQSIALPPTSKSPSAQSAYMTVNAKSVDIDPTEYPVTYYTQSSVREGDQSIIQWRDKYHLGGRSIAVLYLKSGFHHRSQITTTAMTSKMKRYRPQYYADIGQAMPAKQSRGRREKQTRRITVRASPGVRDQGRNLRPKKDNSRVMETVYEQEDESDDDIPAHENEPDSDIDIPSSSTVVGDEQTTATITASRVRDAAYPSFDQVEEDTARSIANSKGITIVFKWCDDNGNQMPDAHSLTMRREAAMQYSSVLKEQLDENPDDSTIEIDPNVTAMSISHDTCERYISCVSPTIRATLPATDRKIALHGVIRTRIKWTPSELFDLYFFAQALGSPHVCDMVIDRFKEMLATGSALPDIDLSAIEKLVRLQDKPAVMFWCSVLAVVLEQELNEPGYATVEQLPEVVRDMVTKATPEAAKVSLFDEETYCANYHHHGEDLCYKVLAEKSKAESEHISVPAKVRAQKRSFKTAQKNKKGGIVRGKAKRREPRKAARRRHAIEYLQNMWAVCRARAGEEQAGESASSEDDDSLDHDDYMI